MHFPVFAEERAVRVNHRRGVVINTLGPFLKKRCHENNLFVTRDFRKKLGARPRDGFGQAEIP